MGLKGIVQTAKTLVAQMNEAAARRQLEIDAVNREVAHAIIDGRLTPAEGLARRLPDAPKARLKPNKCWAARWRKEWGWTNNVLNTAGTYLKYDDPECIRSRERFAHRCAQNNVPLGLVLNFDHVWKSAYRPKKRALRKQRHLLGQPVQPRRTAAQRRATMTASATHTVRSSRRRGGRGTECTRVDAIRNWRKSMTVITSTWGNGTRGPLAFCCPDGMISREFRESFNAANQGTFYIMCSGTPSHFTNSETNFELFEKLYTPAYKLQRAILGLTHADTGLIICDACPSVHSTGARVEKSWMCYLEARPPDSPPRGSHNGPTRAPGKARDGRAGPQQPHVGALGGGQVR